MSDVQCLSDGFECEPVYLHQFLARFIAVQHGHGAMREIECIGQKFAKLVVCAAFKGGRVDLDFERVAEPADDPVTRSVGDGLDREFAGGESVGRFFWRAWWHGVSRYKIVRFYFVGTEAFFVRLILSL